MKKFFSRMREYMTTIVVDGSPRIVRFHDMGKLANCGVFVTNDEALADAMKKDPRFGTEFILDGYNTETEKEEEAPAREYDKVYDYVNRTQNAIEILVGEYGVKRADIKRKADVLRVADELNISFPKLEE